MSAIRSDSVVDSFFALHAGLARQGPGSAETTRHLLNLAGELPARPRVLDVGCGTGQSALLLAVEANAQVTGVDVHQPFLDALARSAIRRGVAGQITTLNTSMDCLPFPDRSFDVIWAEGSVYNIGFETALRGWRRLIEPGGMLVLTELEWSTDNPEAAVRSYWENIYSLRTTEENTATAAAAGYRVCAHWPLPDSDWWDEYYGPLSERLGSVDIRRKGMAEAVRMTRDEIAMWRDHGSDYRYAGYVLRVPGDTGLRI